MKPKQYRKKPVVISAMHWDGSAEGAGPIIDWIVERGGDARYIGKGEAHGLRVTPELRKEWSDRHKAWIRVVKKDAPAFLVIKTLEGNHRADANDYIIEGVKQEHYPCKPDIFAQTYDDAEVA